MPIEQRVVATPPAKIGSRIGGAAPAKPVEPEEPEKPAKPKRRRVLVLLVVAVLLAGGAYVAKDQLLGSGHGSTKGHAPAAAATPKPGAVVQVDPISLNLQGGHYLRLGLALQLTAKTKESPDSAKALDLAIALWSGHTVDEAQDPATRDKLKAELTTQLAKAYDGEVMGVYLTTYVTQ